MQTVLDMVATEAYELGVHSPVHGLTCTKVIHRKGEGYLHDQDYDGPYDVDWVTYCGRCHTWLDAATPPAR